MNYYIILLIVLLVLFTCQKTENMSSQPQQHKYGCGCNICYEKKIINGLCFNSKEQCEKKCTQIYKDVGIHDPIPHKCKYDHDGTYVCNIPTWADRYVR